MEVIATYKTKIIDGHVKALSKVQRHHMNMVALRRHHKWSGFSNSDLMPGIISSMIRKAAIGGRWFDISNLPDCVTVTPDKAGFMATVEFFA